MKIKIRQNHRDETDWWCKGLGLGWGRDGRPGRGGTKDPRDECCVVLLCGHINPHLW